MFSPSPMHLLILGLIVLLVMGPKRLPEIARSLGRGFKELKGSIGGDDGAEATPARAIAGASEPRVEADPEALAARQEPPAPTPEIAEAELVAAGETRPAA